MGVKVAPFHGMTDLLLLRRQTTCVIQSSKSNVICSIEIGGDTKYKSVEIFIASKMKIGGVTGEDVFFRLGSLTGYWQSKGQDVLY